MDVIINNAAPGTVQTLPQAVLPQAAVPQTYVPSQAVPYGYGPYGYGPFRSHDGGGGFPGVLFVLLIVGGVLLFRRRRRDWRRMAGAGGPGDVREDVRDAWRRGRDRFLGDRALDLARERYARGEINADEYETLRRTLSGEEPRPTAQPDGGNTGTRG